MKLISEKTLRIVHSPSMVRGNLGWESLCNYCMQQCCFEIANPLLISFKSGFIWLGRRRVVETQHLIPMQQRTHNKTLPSVFLFVSLKYNGFNVKTRSFVWIYNGGSNCFHKLKLFFPPNFCAFKKKNLIDIKSDHQFAQFW